MVKNLKLFQQASHWSLFVPFQHGFSIMPDRISVLSHSCFCYLGQDSWQTPFTHNDVKQPNRTWKLSAGCWLSLQVSVENATCKHGRARWLHDGLWLLASVWQASGRKTWVYERICRYLGVVRISTPPGGAEQHFTSCFIKPSVSIHICIQSSWSALH